MSSLVSGGKVDGTANILKQKNVGFWFMNLIMFPA